MRTSYWWLCQYLQYAGKVFMFEPLEPQQEQHASRHTRAVSTAGLVHMQQGATAPAHFFSSSGSASNRGREMMYSMPIRRAFGCRGGDRGFALPPRKHSGFGVQQRANSPAAGHLVAVVDDALVEVLCRCTHYQQNVQ
jgi:hypothetical protein